MIKAKCTIEIVLAAWGGLLRDKSAGFMRFVHCVIVSHFSRRLVFCFANERVLWQLFTAQSFLTQCKKPFSRGTHSLPCGGHKPPDSLREPNPSFKTERRSVVRQNSFHTAQSNIASQKNKFQWSLPISVGYFIQYRHNGTVIYSRDIGQ